MKYYKEQQELTEEEQLRNWYEEISKELEDLLYDPHNLESGYQLFTRKDYNEHLNFWRNELLGIDYHKLGVL